MDGEFVEAIQKGVAVPVEMESALSRVFVPPGWTDAGHRKLPDVQALTVGTLTGLKGYYDGATDDDQEMFLHVIDPGHVALRGKLADEAGQYRRQTYIVASLDMVGPSPLRFGQYMEAEEFMIALMSGCMPTQEQKDLIEFIASIRESNVRDSMDSGYAQEVRVVKGVTLVANKQVPNPVTLAPYRTFREIKQPESKFVLRAQSNPNKDLPPRLALFEAEGNFWKIAAVDWIRVYLNEHMPSVPVIA